MTSRADHEKDPAYGLKLRLGSGRRLKLGERLGRGGEGSVHAAANRRNHAVKLYKAPDKPQLANKIAAMVDAGLARQSPFAAFPVDVVHTQDGAFAGFLMKAVRDRRPLHDLYAPGARKQHFPDIDYRFLARTATNIARAVASIHHTGCVIGDINPSGMLVADDATVALVDADSFQFSHGGQQFLCTVGVPDYTPLELQGQSFHGVVRTQQHDAFGLAVILFQVLMMGRHPFDGVPDTGEAPLMGERIQRRLYPHIPERPTGMQPPPGLPALTEFSGTLADLFARAFTTQGNTPRPDALQWVTALEHFEKTLRRCRTDRRHHYPHESTTCPWCQMEEQLGNQLFPRPGQVSPTAQTAPAPANLTQKRFRSKRPRRFIMRLAITAAVALGLYHLAASYLASLSPTQILANQAKQHLPTWVTGTHQKLQPTLDAARQQGQHWVDSAKEAMPDLSTTGKWIKGLWQTESPDDSQPPAPATRKPQDRADDTAPAHNRGPALTITDKVMEMQRVLRRQGYPVPLNGSFDAATRRYAADYLTSISGEPTPENLGVREFYLRFEGVR